jgi:hypothetical protein
MYEPEKKASIFNHSIGCRIIDDRSNIHLFNQKLGRLHRMDCLVFFATFDTWHQCLATKTR